MANMEIDVKRPEIQIKYIASKRSFDENHFTRECESWASGLLGRPYVDRDGFSKYTYYTMPDSCDLNRLKKLFKISWFAGVYDDEVEKHPERRHKWRQIFNEKVCAANDDPIEAIYAQIWNDIRQDFTENQRKRFLRGLDNHLGYQEKRESIVFGTPDEYFAYRYNDSGGDLFVVFVEYALELKLDSSPLDHYLVRAFFENTARYATMINDIFSFKKEYLEEGAKYNYVTIISGLHGCSFQEAVDFIGKQLPIVESNILLYSEEIFKMKIPVEKELINGLIKSVYANVFWHMTSNRFK